MRFSKAAKLENGLLGIYIHNIKNQFGMTDTPGKNPFDYWHKAINGKQVFFNKIYSTYDWVLNQGYYNIGTWIEDAAVAAGR